MKKIYSILFFLICVCTTYAQDVVTPVSYTHLTLPTILRV